MLRHAVNWTKRYLHFGNGLVSLTNTRGRRQSSNENVHSITHYVNSILHKQELITTFCISVLAERNLFLRPKNVSICVNYKMGFTRYVALYFSVLFSKVSPIEGILHILNYFSVTSEK